MNDLVPKALQSLSMAAGMFWEVGWSLVFGFLISSVLQVFVSKQSMQKALGRNGFREVALASVYGAASSSCSYASASIMRTLFKKGAALIPSLAFLFASTNLVLELGILLYVLMGWQFMAAEWIGGLVLIALMSLLVKLTYPTQLVEEARNHSDEIIAHEHSVPIDFTPKWNDKKTWIAVAQNFAMDWHMLWKDLVIGFVVAGILSAFVPSDWWSVLFMKNSGWLHLPANAVLGVLLAVFTFVCSCGNVPLAAILWGSGISFGGVLAFIYADLVVLPLLDVYRRYYGWKMAAYIAGIFTTTMILAALIMDYVFTALGLVPSPGIDIRVEGMPFSFNYTFWLNLIFGALALYLFIVARRNPSEHSNHSCCHGG